MAHDEAASILLSGADNRMVESFGSCLKFTDAEASYPLYRIRFRIDDVRRTDSAAAEAEQKILAAGWKPSNQKVVDFEKRLSWRPWLEPATMAVFVERWNDRGPHYIELTMHIDCPY